MSVGQEAKRDAAEAVRRELWGDDHADRLALLRAFEPELADVVVTEVFGGLYADERLALRERCLCTIASLVTQGRPAQLASHLEAATRLGVRTHELSAVLAHLVPYVGLPSVLQAYGVLRDVVDAQRATGGEE